MLTITFNGGSSLFFDEAFFDQNGNQSSDVSNVTSTSITVTNTANGAVTLVTGNGFAFNASGDPIGGTITGVSFQQGGVEVTNWSGLSWDLATFADALDQLEDFNSNSILSSLFSQQDIVIDASNATSGLQLDLTGIGDLSITSNISVTGSDFGDWLLGGLGNDTINPGNNDGSPTDVVEGTLGNDRIVFGNAAPASFYELAYFDFDRAITATIGANANTATINATGSFDTIVGINNVLNPNADGLFLGGTGFNDVFNVNSLNDGYLEVFANSGNDTINADLSGNGTLRLSYFGANQGVNVNLLNGTATDGTGGIDTINLTNNTGNRVLEIRGTDFNDTILGTNGNERFILQGGNDTLNGGGGDRDLVRFDRSDMDSGVSFNMQTGVATGTWNGVGFSHSITNVEEVRGSRDFGDVILGNAANNYMEGRGGNDSLLGDAGNDTLDGGAGNDTLRGGTGRDRLIGGEGNDLLDASVGDAGTEGFGDIVKAGLGQDTILGNATVFFNAGEGIDLSYNDVSGVGGLTILVGNQGTGTVTSGTAGLVNDTFSYADYFTGSQDNDRIVGSNNPNFEGFQGHSGNDTINGSGGYDEVFYSDDRFGGGNAGVVVNLGTGRALDGFGDIDTLLNIEGVIGTLQADRFIGSAQSFTNWRGLAGNDTIQGGSGFDRLDHSRDANEGGTAGITANLGTGLVLDGFGNLDSVSNIDGIRGTAKGDIMRAGSTAVQFRGEGGNDQLFGSGQSDTLEGGSGNDAIVGDSGNDTLQGGAGNDTMNGDAGFDEMFGGAGQDVLRGGAQADILHGGADNDILLGQEGLDNLFGDAGNDRLNGDAGNDRLSGGLGNDTLRGGVNEDRLEGDDGNDVLFGDAGFDRLEGGAGEDELHGGAQADNLFGGIGNDTMFGDEGFDRLFGGAGDDVGHGGEGTDGMFGEQGNDTLNGGAGNDRFFGGTGNDVIDGGADNDTIFGGAGFDTIIGGSGNDQLSGNFNADIFIFNDGFGVDVITDFAATNDFEKIDLSGVTAITNPFDLFSNHMSQVGSNVVIDDLAGNTIALQGVNIGDLDNSDFLF